MNDAILEAYPLFLGCLLIQKNKDLNHRNPCLGRIIYD